MPLHNFRKNFTMRRLQALLAQKDTCPYIPVPNSLLYVAANCMPYHINGYTIRTHEIITALINEGIDVHAITRAGYPWDTLRPLKPRGALNTSHEDIEYAHAKRPLKLLSLVAYVKKAAPYIMAQAIQHKAACIHAASNYTNALPAMVAAKRLGIPFQYEMRGLWELSRIAQNPRCASRHRQVMGLHLERFVAHHADRVICISEALAHFVGLHIDHKKVCLLPNCVDAKRIFPKQKPNVVPGHIGYAGALVSYEGLDILLQAVKKLAPVHKNIFLHIIGNGAMKKQWERLTQHLGITEHVCFYGKLSPEAARQRLEQCALVCIPRAPLEVCKRVPPIKLVEAMALGKCVVLPDLPVFQEEASQVPAFFFEAGNGAHLAEVLGQALGNTEDLIQRGQACRDYVLKHRQWQCFTSSILPQEKI